MKIIDAHAHFFPDPLYKAIWKWFERHGWQVRYQVMADEAVTLLRSQGISRFTVLNYAHKAGMSEALNHWTYEFCQKYPEAIPFGAVHQDDDIPKVLDTCFRRYHFHGIKFHCHVAAIPPDDELLFPLYEGIIQHDKVLTLHAGNGPSLEGYKEKTAKVSGARRVRKVLQRYPNLKLIMPHLGAEEFDAFFDLMEEFPNLWMDTTMICSGYFPNKIPWKNLEKFSSRILYGSDFPNIPYEMTTEAKNIQASILSPEAKKNILCKNAIRLLKLSSE